jgi:TetR/AcrR family transcriptional regulator, cholesterol catabolism regulator
MAPGAGRYDDILDAFTRHIAEHGYDGTNFGTVAAELGLSKGTIVHHFGSKDRILAALHESYIGRRLAELDLLIARLDSPATRLAAILHAFIHYQVADRVATVAFQREIARLAEQESMARGRALREEYLGKLSGVIREGVDEGAFRPVDPRLDSLFVFGSAHWAWTWFTPDGRSTVDEVGAAFVDLMMAGLLTDRSGLAALTSPTGRAARTMRQVLHEVAERSAA